MDMLVLFWTKCTRD